MTPGVPVDEGETSEDGPLVAADDAATEPVTDAPEDAGTQATDGP